jgi:hypothetical protein
MLGPLVILAILSVIGGFMGWPEALGGSNWFSHFLAPAVATTTAVPTGDNHLELILALISTLVAFTGWLTAHILYYAKPELPARLATSLRPLYALVKNKYWVDEIYGALIVAPVLFIARWVLGVLIDRGVIDGGTLTAGYTAQGFGALVARIQSGNIRRGPAPCCFLLRMDLPLLTAMNTPATTRRISPDLVGAPLHALRRNVVLCALRDLCGGSFEGARLQPCRIDAPRLALAAEGWFPSFQACAAGFRGLDRAD